MSTTEKIVDVEVVNSGSIFRFHLLTDKAREWVEQNVETDGWQWLGNALCVGHRYACDLADGMLSDELIVK